MAMVPPDARAARPFRILKGTDDLIRSPRAVASASAELEVGEWIGVNASGQAAKVTATVVTAPDQTAECCWTHYKQNYTNEGHPDAVATGQFTGISGKYVAETTFFKTGETYTPGFLLVVILVSGVGVLAPVDPASADAETLAGAVAKVVKYASGRLTYRTL